MPQPDHPSPEPVFVNTTNAIELYEINPNTILSRRSNFGVATYEAVKKMKADGIISGNEDGKELLELPEELDLDGAGDLTHTLHATLPPLDIPAEDVLPPENEGTAS